MRIKTISLLFIFWFLAGCGRDQLLLETRSDKFSVRISAERTSFIPEGYDIIAQITNDNREVQSEIRFDHVDVVHDFLNHFSRWEWSDQKTLCFFSENYRKNTPKAKVILINPNQFYLSLATVETTPLQCIKIENDIVGEIKFEIPVDIGNTNWIRIFAAGPHFESEIHESVIIRESELDVPIIIEMTAEGLLLVRDHAEVD